MRRRGHGLGRGGGSDISGAIVVVGRSLVRGELVFGDMLAMHSPIYRAATRLRFL